MTRILVVEDDELLASSLVRALGYEGYEVETRGDGIDALDQVKRNPPDLVILDVMLPGMEGVEVCRRIRLESQLPVLMLTARDRAALASARAGLLLGRAVGTHGWLTLRACARSDRWRCRRPTQ